jgi:hypothetical protein
VFIAINSTHSSQASIILFTALFQPHPIHTTFILATGEILHERLTSSTQLLTEALPDNKFFNLSSLFTIMIF